MSLAAKLLEIQRDVKTVGFDATNPHFKNSYATLGKVLETVLPKLQEKGILLTQPDSHINGAPALITRFVDVETGETLEETAPLVLEKATPQGLGSAKTYSRRYNILSALGLVGDVDDDAEAAEPTKPGSAYIVDTKTNKVLSQF